MSAVVKETPNIKFQPMTEAGGCGSGPVSVEPYVSQQWYELERERVFRRAWLCMGRVEQMPGPDTWMTKEVEICGALVLITRDANDEVRAFHNVCSHRQNMIVREPYGEGKRLFCRYHNWAYANTGECIGIPDIKNFFNVDKSQCGLSPIACDVWQGWVFINLQKEPEVSLLEFLGPYAEAYDGMPYPFADNAFEVVSNLKVNWKQIADAFAESYHVSAIHPATIGSTFASERLNPFGRPLSGTAYGLHRAIATFGNPDYEPPEHAHVEKLAYANIDTGNVLGGTDTGALRDLINHPAANPTKEPTWGADVSWLFPNFNIDYGPGGFWTHEFWPTSVNTTRWLMRVHVPVAENVRMRLMQEHFAARFAEVMLEDVTNTERQQKAMESGAKTQVLLQDGEFMIRHNLETLGKWVRSDSVREAMGLDDACRAAG
ncbi:MAG: Rieske 2Fe-2S domain-containing protein [Salinisphaera sp.]|nr:Rieske 2Fe-2S domain-containing protein [Salinisphaera sp.]